MKKLITFLAVISFAGSLMAQQLTTNEPFPFEGKAPVDQKALLRKLQMHPTKELPVGWMIPSWNLLDYFWQSYSQVTHYANVMFPDSTAVYESGGTTQHNWLNSVGGVFDPYSEMYDSLQFQPLISDTSPYRIDSIFLLGWYNIVSAVAPDTLVLEIENGTPHTSPEFAWTVYNFPSDTFNISPPSVLGIPTEKGFLCRMTAPSKTVIKYPLTTADSTLAFGKYITIPVHYDVPAGKIVGLSITFVPGYPYAYGDMLYSYSHTLNPVINCLRAGLYGTIDTGTDPFIFAEPYHHWTSQHYINTNVRYGLWTGSNSWRNNRMVSTVNWGFDIGYYVTNTTPGFGISENAQAKPRIYPNPSQGLINIETAAAGSHIRVFDMPGKCLIDRLTVKANESLDLKGLQNGLYFVEIEKGGVTSTHKIVLNR